MAEDGEDIRSAAITDEATVGDQGATQNTGWGADTEAHFDEITSTLNSHAATINSIILALEKAGIIADN